MSEHAETNPEALSYFFRRAVEVPQPTLDEDDRRCCSQCANLSEHGVCLAAKCGEFFAGRNYRPVRDLPRRCEGYAPRPDDPDRRHGRERWPGLLVQGVNHGE